MKKLIFPIFITIIIAVTVLYSSENFFNGYIGATKLNGEGCICHSLSLDNNVSVFISGPTSLEINSTGNYSVTITGGPAVRGGFNIAKRFGTLINSDASTQIIDSELTHTTGKNFSGGSVSWNFQYTAPSTAGVTDTLYAAALSANGNGFPDDNDKWNFSNNFPIIITNIIPVELTSFSVSKINNQFILKWVTASETNNKGFEIQSSLDAKDWQQVGFVSGKGTSVQTNNYEFILSNNQSSYFRLKQIDYEGSFTYSNVVNYNSELPDEFTLFQNYPNPFNPSTKIKFSIPTDLGINTNVSLKVYDILGNQIASLLENANLSPGVYEVEFNSNKLNHPISSGIYLYELQAGKFKSVKKFILNK